MGAKPRTPKREQSEHQIGLDAKNADEGVTTIFETIRALVHEVQPGSVESEKWGTLHFEKDGNLFALSVKKRLVNFYVLIPGLLREFETLAHIPQSSCCLRLSAEEPLLLAELRRLAKTAIERKTAS